MTIGNAARKVFWGGGGAVSTQDGIESLAGASAGAERAVTREENLRRAGLWREPVTSGLTEAEAQAQLGNLERALETAQAEHARAQTAAAAAQASYREAVTAAVLAGATSPSSAALEEAQRVVQTCAHRAAALQGALEAFKPVHARAKIVALEAQVAELAREDSIDKAEHDAGEAQRVAGLERREVAASRIGARGWRRQALQQEIDELRRQHGL